MEDLSYEQQAHDAGYALVCGVDEAGAGPLMGPVYAAAVILPEKFELPGLNDSKKLTEYIIELCRNSCKLFCKLLAHRHIQFFDNLFKRCFCLYKIIMLTF